MKIKQKDFDYMRAKCEIVLKMFPNAWDQYSAEGKSIMRFRWDVARQANLIPFFCDTIYKYANDTHIETALKKIMPLKG